MNISEYEFYRAEITTVREATARWEDIGAKFNKHDDPHWQFIRDLQKVQLQYLEAILGEIN